MKLVEKIAERIGSFSPMIIFILLCISYLWLFENQPSYPEQIKKEIKEVDKKTDTDNALHSFWSYRD